jgi:hypothetical protein
VFDSQTKFQSENVMAHVYLGIAIAGANTLIVMAGLSRSLSYEGPPRLAASFVRALEAFSKSEWMTARFERPSLRLFALK